MCDHGFIGACAECDNSGQMPQYEAAECGGCGEMTPTCCDTWEGPFCATCCPRDHNKSVSGVGDYVRMDCDQ